MDHPDFDPASDVGMLAAAGEVEKSCQAIREAIAAYEAKLDIEGKDRSDSIKFLYVFTKTQMYAASLEILNIELNYRIQRLLADQNDTNDYLLKQKLAKDAMKFIKERMLSIYVSEEHPRCSFYAIASRDGTGRYTFENRDTKKRFGHYKCLSEILPLRCSTQIDKHDEVLMLVSSQIIETHLASINPVLQPMAIATGALDALFRAGGRVLGSSVERFIDAFAALVKPSSAKSRDKN